MRARLGVNETGAQRMSLAGLLRVSRLIGIVDIGANPIDGDPPYGPLLSAGLCKVTGFEPQPSALAKLNARKGALETYLPHAIGDGERHTLYVCRCTGMTSLLEPDPAALNLFPRFAELGQIMERRDIATVRLDDIAELGAVDFLKIDAQGAELVVLKGGRSKLSGAVAVQTEVSFVPLYKGQPSFGEIDMEMRAQGFLPHATVSVNRRLLLPMRTDNPHAHINQMLEADIVYVRDIRHMQDWSDTQLAHMAIIAHYCYRSFDLTIKCLSEMVGRGVASKDILGAYSAELSAQS